MFLTATKTLIVDSLRSVWFSGNQDVNNDNSQLTNVDDPYPRRITVEYPEEAEDWPCILVQVRPTVIEWTGISADEIVNPGSEDAPVYKSIRQGRFEATCMLQIMATESQTRDRIWDNLINVLLMGRKRSATQNFYNSIETADYIGLTIQEGTVRNVGDTVGMGTPWNQELLTYEASIEFDMVGVFYADEYNESLMPIKIALTYEYIDLVEDPPFEDDLGLFSTTTAAVIDKTTDPVINIQLTDDIPAELINGDNIVNIDGDEFTVLQHQWIATIDKEVFIVIMVGDNDPSLIRVNRAQADTSAVRHKLGATFRHEGDEWKTWLA